MSVADGTCYLGNTHLPCHNPAMDPAKDDVRGEELETLEAIYPEISHPDPDNFFAFELELPVEPAHPLTVTFPPLAAGPVPPPPGVLGLQHAPHAQPDEDSVQITYLPSLNLRITLPPGYPRDEPPKIDISTNPPWLSADIIGKLQDDGPRLWDEAGRDMMAFAYIDHVQRATDDVFGTVDPDGALHLDPQHKLAVLDYDLKAKTVAFGKKTFECGVCLVCHEMLDCGHVFCLQCLQDFYNDAINTGSIETVRCITPNCAKDRAESQSKGKTRKTRKMLINPSELLQIGLSEDTVKRYVSLKYKMELEADKNTVYCPRSWCNGAARSKTHKKPSGLEVIDASDSESEPEMQGGQEGGDAKKTTPVDKSMEDLIAICEDCSFAFCSRCFQSWHGTFFYCRPKRINEELTEEEKASLEYIQRYTSPCPTCGASTQKTFGCNHMLCSRCHTHFCYLCSAWLEPGNPYKHYNNERSQCYMRLWELEEGDGEAPGPGAPPQRIQAPEQEVFEEVEEFEVFVDEGRGHDHERPDRNRNRRLDERGQPVAVAREAPLVLRLVNDHGQQNGLGAQPVPPPAPDAPQPFHHGQNRLQQGQRPGNVPDARRGRGGGRGQPGRARRARGAQGRGGRGGVGANNNNNAFRRHQDAQDQQGVDGLDAAQQAWVRHFVQMALIDAEDQIEGDSDEEGENWIIP
ncbi:E3 ubiquitin-protein ligase itt1 [Paramyrothecium foliicola]|nr:E3 ubiquitin-protein ligase itt1 [Paramyrothecium foliicola]